MKKTLYMILIMLIASALAPQLLFSSAAQLKWRYETDGKYGGTFVYGDIGSEPAHLNPIMTTVSNTHTVVPNIFNSLITSDTEWNFWPSLAYDWTISEDGLKYTFYLVSNATWHDGTPFTAADVEFTVNQGWKNDTVCPYSPSIFGFLENATAIDDYTVVLNMKQSFAPILLYLSGTLYASIIPKHIYEGTDILTNPANMEPIGTGPFMFDTWAHSDYITVVRNPNYFKAGLPYLDKIVHKIIPDVVSAQIAMEVGEIDGRAVPPLKYEEWSQNPNFYLVSGRDTAQAGIHIIQFIMREDRPPVGGFSAEALKVRTALSHATNRSWIIENVFFGLPHLGTSPFHYKTWGYKNVAADNPIPYDIDLANQLLDDAGYPVQGDGWRFELYMPYVAGGEEEKIAEYLRDNWQKVGVKVTLEGMDRPTKLGKWGRGEFDVIMEGPYHGPDSSVTTGRFYLSTNIVLFPYTNCQQYNKSIVDDLFIIAQTTVNETYRQEVYDQVQEIIWNDVPTIWIGEKMNYWAYSVKFLGEPISPFGADDSLETLYWTEGSVYTEANAQAAIAKAEADIADLAAQMYKVDACNAKLAEARAAYDAGDWDLAITLANAAASLASPPYELYLGIIGIVVIGVGGVIWYRRRR